MDGQQRAMNVPDGTPILSTDSDGNTRRVIQLIPAPGWFVVYQGGRLPLAAWALVEVWESGLRGEHRQEVAGLVSLLGRVVLAAGDADFVEYRYMG